MAEMSEAKAREIAQMIQRWAKDPEVARRVRERIAQCRLGMPRGASAEVLHTRMGY